MNYLAIIYVLTILFAVSHGDEYLDVSAWEGGTEECGRTKFENDSMEIDGYHKAKSGEFPWMVLVGSVSPENVTIFFCGGSLISKRYVISEVECGRFSKFVRLGATSSANIVGYSNLCDGDDDCNVSYQDIAIRKRIFGNDCSLQSDRIMVVELEKAAEYNDYVHPICIPTASSCNKLELKDRVYILGWGKVYPKFQRMQGIMSETKDMMYINTDVITAEECSDFYPDHLNATEICVRYPTEVSHHCVGDSGGPLVEYIDVDGVKRAFLRGVAKITPIGCETEHIPPVVYTSICSFSDWIAQQIKASTEQEKEVEKMEEEEGEEDKVEEKEKKEKKEEERRDESRCGA